jgi:predicted ATPase
MTGFVGRGRELAEVGALLRRERVVTLTGAGGLGKTRLAMRVALERANERQVLVVRRPGNEAAGFGAARSAYEVAGFGARRPPYEMAGARDGGLVVLDRCQGLTEEVGALVDGLAGVSFLLTSREPVRVPGERVWPVPPLGTAESVRLFLDRAEAAGGAVADAVGDVERLCEILDGVPLALELAAARTPLLTPGRIVERIAGRHGLMSTGDRPMRAALEWSHELLSPKERLLLRRLAVLRGPFAPETAVRVCGDGGMLRGREIPGLLDRLTATALLSRKPDAPCEGASTGWRYVLHDVVREYAGERLREAGEESWASDRLARAGS